MCMHVYMYMCMNILLCPFIYLCTCIYIRIYIYRYCYIYCFLALPIAQSLVRTDAYACMTGVCGCIPAGLFDRVTPAMTI